MRRDDWSRGYFSAMTSRDETMTKYQRNERCACVPMNVDDGVRSSVVDVAVVRFLTSFSLAASSSNEGLPITSRGVSMMGGGGASLA